ncbi:hypothetical protein Q4Q39_15235 [Flavivirga amylovorans]|uniref:Uncharacterized protein n=1 Tax=Flavivirga amylovorans TaxID=870486 RepID=A0ABT8X5C7_9FLAO|nr:hypothetical protein [Flavivirga amylovorans]MDO5988765.1 hypothetical protein [Flavivirga amylovorans]
MRRLLLVLIPTCLLSIYSCDDGDVITVELDFEDSFSACGETNLIFYKTKNDPSESLSLKINNFTFDELLEIDESTGVFTKDVTISTTNPFNYRTYSNTTLPTSGLFCSDVPLSDVVITQDVESTSGTAQIKTVLTEDDNDGIPAEFEGKDENLDTDGDGIPNYIDADDDGDNILTKDEAPDPNNDGDFSDAEDTDGDGVPDYLDDDDDGDDIKTRDEENQSVDLNPANDITIGNTPDYLNPDVSTEVKATAYRTHNITQTHTVTLTISNFDLTLISLDVFDFGTLSDSRLTKTIEVETTFN